ncbi:regulating synaptic membrane exocytosis protein 2 [Plakobranchus ocellatus]|uniref:Regulating synaptic membrane exocytosis protein 2 n=1 Tax=Plakobranchus ocellatus TaxID=259542 RepID=A0AAV3Z5E5_9GAST|nr:regulating synaptic membrane exocytosis protein 2 [Plakobranchus ocellatus]
MRRGTRKRVLLTVLGKRHFQVVHHCFPRFWEDRRHEDTLDRRRDAKDRRKESRGGGESGGGGGSERDRYRQSPVNGGRREEGGGSYRGSRERLSDLQQQQQQQQQAGLDGSGADTASELSRSERQDRRSGSTRHHRSGTGSGGGSAGSGAERTAKEQRRSPSRDRDRANKDGGVIGGDVHDMQLSRHRILIDHASDTQAEDPRDTISVDPSDKKQHLDPSSAGGRTRNNRKKLESMLRNDSLSSDPSDCVRPPPPKPHKHRRGKKQRQQSLSSSEDEIQSTPECSSCEELDLESESVSEKGELESVGGSVGSGRRRAVKSGLTKARLETLAKPTLYDTGRGTSLETESGSSEPQVKDSGNDTGMSSSSNQTINTVDEAAAAAAAAVAVGAVSGGGGAGSAEAGGGQWRQDVVPSARRQAKMLADESASRRASRSVAEKTVSRRRAKVYN